MSRISTRSLGAVAAVAAIPLAISSAAMSQAPIVVEGLQAPRGLSVSGDALLIAAQADGRILRLAADGTVTPLFEGIVAGTYESPEGTSVVGVNAAIQVGDLTYFTVGGSLGTVASTEGVYVARAGEAPRLLADLGQLERDNNTGGDVTPEGAPDIDSNPYDLVSDGADGVFVSDAAANAIFHIAADGTITLYAQFPDLPNPLAGTLGGPFIDQVPTGLAIGPDGALYVTTLTGFPFAAGAASVYRVADVDGDGDALEDGETTVFAGGLTTATDLAFDNTGALLVTEFSTDFLANAPGRLVRIVDGNVTEVAGGLVSPTGIAVLDGRIFVAQEFAGIVTEIAAP